MDTNKKGCIVKNIFNLGHTSYCNKSIYLSENDFLDIECKIPISQKHYDIATKFQKNNISCLKCKNIINKLV